MIRTASFSRPGPRDDNQDRIVGPLQHGAATLIGVADGVGGGPAGDVAASIASQAAAQSFANEALMSQIFDDATEALQKYVIDHPNVCRMATTLSVAIIDGQRCTVGHVGDSRVYHLRNSGIVDLTIDQTEVAELLRRGVITTSQARRYPRRNRLISVVSKDRNRAIHTATVDVKRGDRVLAVTDGVHEVLKRGSVARLSSETADIEEFMRTLSRAVENAGPKDNYSAIVAQIE